MLTPNARLTRSAARVVEVRAMQTISEGGSSDSEHSEVAVQPVRCSPRPAVMSATPLASSRIARRNAAPSRSTGAPLTRLERASSIGGSI